MTAKKFMINQKDEEVLISLIDPQPDEVQEVLSLHRFPCGEICFMGYLSGDDDDDIADSDVISSVKAIIQMALELEELEESDILRFRFHPKLKISAQTLLLEIQKEQDEMAA